MLQPASFHSLVCDLVSSRAAQVEYYLSDENLKYDKFFHDKISANADGWLDAGQHLTIGVLCVCYAKQVVSCALSAICDSHGVAVSHARI